MHKVVAHDGAGVPFDAAVVAIEELQDAQISAESSAFSAWQWNDREDLRLRDGQVPSFDRLLQSQNVCITVDLERKVLFPALDEIIVAAALPELSDELVRVRHSAVFRSQGSCPACPTRNKKLREDHVAHARLEEQAGRSGELDREVQGQDSIYTEQTR